MEVLDSAIRHTDQKLAEMENCRLGTIATLVLHGLGRKMPAPCQSRHQERY